MSNAVLRLDGTVTQRLFGLHTINRIEDIAMSIRMFAALCGLSLATVGGCAHDSTKTAAVGTPVTPLRSESSFSTPSTAHACSVDSDCHDKQLCIRSQCVDITPDLAECSTVRVQFDFNDANLHDTAGPKLERMARCLKADHGLQVTIEGNADERGTEEWNIALGDKRATSVAQYLERLGVSQAQLRTVSYGKERPLCEEHNEACWAKNRRAAVTPQATR